MRSTQISVHLMGGKYSGSQSLVKRIHSPLLETETLIIPRIRDCLLESHMHVLITPAIKDALCTSTPS